MERFVKPRLSSYISYYRATVTQAAAGGYITVKRPFDSEVSLRCTGGAEDLQVGDQCTVFVFGDSSNAVVVGNGSLSIFGGGGGGGGGGSISPYTGSPQMDGVASAGTSSNYSRGDHRHPSDTSKANASSVPASASVNSSNVMSFASSGGTTLFSVQLPESGGGAEPSDANPLMDGVASAGSSSLYARGDHRHPSDTTIPTSASIDENGLISFKSSTDATLFTLQMPLYDGSVINSIESLTDSVIGLAGTTRSVVGNPFVSDSSTHLWDGTTGTSDEFIDESGNVVQSTGSITSPFISVLQNHLYVWSGTSQTSSSSNHRVHGFDASGNWVEMITKQQPSAGAAYSIMFAINNPNITQIKMSCVGGDTNVSLICYS